MIKKKIIIYLRKSRTDNQFESINEVLQRHEQMLQDYCIRVFGEPIHQDNIYREVVSGETINERPMMMQLLEEVEKGNIDAVVVVEPQRLSRGSFGDIDRIVNTFKYTNTKIITPSKSYDLNNKFDRKYFEQELLRGNDYLEYVKEILMRGRKQSVEDGLYIGSAPPFGYDKKKLAKKGFTLVPNKDAETIKLIFQLCLKGIGTTNIAKELIDLGIKSKNNAIWTPSMVRNILINSTYAGYVTYGKRSVTKTMKNGEIVKIRRNHNEHLSVLGLHEPIISKEDFDKVQLLIAPNPTKSARKDRPIKNALAGLVYCKYCGKKMARRPYPHSEPYLICTTIHCKNVSSKLDLVENRIIEMLSQELKKYKYFVDNYEEEIKSNTSMYEREIKKIEKELSALKTDLENALVNYNRNKITEEEYNFLKGFTLQEQNRLQKSKELIIEKMQNEELESKIKAVPILENFIKEYHSLSIVDKNNLLSSIIDKVIYEKKQGGQKNDAVAVSSFTLELFLKI